MTAVLQVSILNGTDLKIMINFTGEQVSRTQPPSTWRIFEKLHFLCFLCILYSPWVYCKFIFSAPLFHNWFCLPVKFNHPGWSLEAICVNNCGNKKSPSLSNKSAKSILFQGNLLQFKQRRQCSCFSLCVSWVNAGINAAPPSPNPWLDPVL